MSISAGIGPSRSILREVLYGAHVQRDVFTFVAIARVDAVKETVLVRELYGKAVIFRLDRVLYVASVSRNLLTRLSNSFTSSCEMHCQREHGSVCLTFSNFSRGAAPRAVSGVSHYILVASSSSFSLRYSLSYSSSEMTGSQARGNVA